jgi:protein gp37
MGENSKIEWPHHTFNAWIGCLKVTDGCTFCYAEKLAKNRMSRFGKLWGPRSDRHRTTGDYWKKPYRWDRLARKAGERHRVFCGSMMDFFEDNPKVAPLRQEMYEIMRNTPNLDWLILTKRPQNINKMLPDDWGNGYPNVWLLASVTSSKDLWMINELACVNAVIKGLSMEPLLGPVNLTRIPRQDDTEVTGVYNSLIRLIDWVIVGGESEEKQKARKCNIAWIESIVKQCKQYDVPVFVKQLGSNPVYPSSALHSLEKFPLIDKKGGDITEFPEGLKLRMIPEFN